MKTFMSIAGLMIVSAACVTCGCAQPEGRQASAMQAAPAVNRTADNHEWVKRLLATTPVQQVQQVSATPGDRMSFPISLPAGNSAQYSLIVDQGMQLAWLQTFGNTAGPWRLDHPDVQKLMNSVIVPPASPALPR